jgi:hypothetical protein
MSPGLASRLQTARSSRLPDRVVESKIVVRLVREAAIGWPRAPEPQNDVDAVFEEVRSRDVADPLAVMDFSPVLKRGSGLRWRGFQACQLSPKPSFEVALHVLGVGLGDLRRRGVLTVALEPEVVVPDAPALVEAQRALRMRVGRARRCGSRLSRPWILMPRIGGCACMGSNGRNVHLGNVVDAHEPIGRPPTRSAARAGNGSPP